MDPAEEIKALELKLAEQTGLAERFKKMNSDVMERNHQLEKQRLEEADQVLRKSLAKQQVDAEQEKLNLLRVKNVEIKTKQEERFNKMKELFEASNEKCNQLELACRLEK